MLSLLLLLAPLPVLDGGSPPLLTNAHAHNDYAHPRPLLDALEQGFCSFEADVFITKDGRLLVGHTSLDLKPERTLEKLYLAPLRERVRQNGGRVYPGGPTVQLLIDIKSAGAPTYAAVHTLLTQYADMLTEVNDGKVTERAITVTISGSCPRQEIMAQKLRYAAIDGRKEDLTSSLPVHLVPLVSLNWRSQFQWNGQGEMPAMERQKLREMAAQAHQHGRRLRFWGVPDTPACWQEQLAARVDWLNTDRLKEMGDFLRAGKAGK
jgi:glycerophosphoryl diester phosphodiesterase